MPRIPQKKTLGKKARIVLIALAAVILIGAVVGVVLAVKNATKLPDSYSYYVDSPATADRLRDMLINKANEKQALKIYVYSDDVYKTDGVGRRVYYTYYDLETEKEMVTSYAAYSDFFSKSETEQLKNIFDNTLVKDIYLEITSSGELTIYFNEDFNEYGWPMALAYIAHEPDDANVFFGTAGYLIGKEIGDGWYFLRRVL